MDSLPPFDEDDFFGSYDPEKAGGVALASLDFDAAEPPPTPEQLAHWTRFRRPVAGVVAAMGLLSIVALGIQGSQQHGSQRELVAHYGAAIAAPTLTATTKQTAEAEGSRAAVSEASSDLVPEALSALVLDALSVLVPVASTASASPPAVAASATGPALELAPPDTLLTELFIRPNSGMVKAFVPAPSPMCLRLADSDLALDDLSHAAGPRQLPTMNPISCPQR